MATHRLMVNIDSIMDTLYGAAYQVDPKVANRLATDDLYYDRVNNDLSNIIPCSSEVMALYGNRNTDTLRNSRSTPLMNTIADHASSFNIDNAEHPGAMILEVTVNMYPYELSQVEVVSYFTALKNILGVNKLLSISRPLRRLTPKYIKRNFDQFIIHDLSEWTGYHHNALKLDPMPSVICNAPSLLLPGVAVDTNINKVMMSTQSAFSSHLEVELLPLSDYTIDRSLIQ